MKEKQERKTAPGLYPVLITIIGSMLMLLMLLLPYASATEEYKEWLLEYAREDYAEGAGITNEEAVQISLAEFMKIYMKVANQGIYKETSILCTVIIGIFAVFSLLTLLMSIRKKPIGIIVFDILALIVFHIIHFDFEDRGVIANSSYNWGISNYLGYIAGIMVFIGAVWLFIEKTRTKKMAVPSSPL